MCVKNTPQLVERELTTMGSGLSKKKAPLRTDNSSNACSNASPVLGEEDKHPADTHEADHMSSGRGPTASEMVDVDEDSNRGHLLENAQVSPKWSAPMCTIFTIKCNLHVSYMMFHFPH